jgi:hypothetical protein
MLVVFVEEVSERLIYTLDFIFRDRQIEYQITNDPIYYNKLKGFKFNYSNRFFESGVHIQPSDLIFSEEIKEYNIKKSLFYKLECLSFDGVVDPIASVFYLISRYEEYIILKRDNHDRFQAKNSLQYEYGWLKQCICDRWCEDLISFMEEEYKRALSSFKFQTTIVPTFDVDNVRAFEWKEGVRTWVAIWKDRISKDRDRLELRQRVLNKEKKDPYDTFDYILDISHRGFDVKMFWLVGDFAKYDRNISVNDIRHRSLIKKMSSQTTLGIHPSYKSNLSGYYLEKEIERIELITSERPMISRQHYLKLNLPQTYRQLIHYGILEDYTMGYADEVGFRAGTARPFYFFDLQKNHTTNLLVHSFAYMDRTLKDYLNLNKGEAFQIVEELFREINAYGGEYICLWHNESLGNAFGWNGWSEVLEYTLTFKNEIH